MTKSSQPFLKQYLKLPPSLFLILLDNSATGWYNGKIAQGSRLNNLQSFPLWQVTCLKGSFTG